MARSRPTPRNQPKPRISNRVNLRQAKKDVRSQKKRFRNFHLEIDFAIYLWASRKLSLVFPQKQFLKKRVLFWIERVFLESLEPFNTFTNSLLNVE